MINSKSYKFLPIAFLIIGIVAFFSFSGQNYLSLNAIKENYQSIITFANSHFLISIIVFSCVIAVVVTLSITGATYYVLAWRIII